MVYAKLIHMKEINKKNKKKVNNAMSLAYALQMGSSIEDEKRMLIRQEKAKNREAIKHIPIKLLNRHKRCDQRFKQDIDNMTEKQQKFIEKLSVEEFQIFYGPNKVDLKTFLTNKELMKFKRCTNIKGKRCPYYKSGNCGIFKVKPISCNNIKF